MSEIVILCQYVVSLCSGSEPRPYHSVYVHKRLISPLLVNAGPLNPQSDGEEQFKNHAEPTVFGVESLSKLKLFFTTVIMLLIQHITILEDLIKVLIVFAL